MRILYSYYALDSAGGADRMIAEKASWLAEHGYEVAIALAQQCGRPLSFPVSDKVKIVDMDIDFDEQYKYYRKLLRRYLIYRRCMQEYQRRMQAFIAEWKPDIIDSTIGRDISFLSRLKDGSVKMGEFHTSKENLRGFQEMAQRGPLFRIVAKWNQWRTEKAVGRLATLVCLTKTDAEAWQGIAKTTVIPNFFPFVPERQSTCEAKQAIAVGRYSKEKGFEYMVEAWRIVAGRHPDWTLNVYGGIGGEREKIERLVREAGIERQMRLYDATPDIEQRYTESSLLVMSSRVEGFPMVLLEAMACGVPCVAFDCHCGPRDIIRDGQDGIVSPYLDSKAMADNICRLIENTELRKQMGRKAAENVRRYDKEKIMHQWQQLFAKLTGKPTPPTEQR